MKKYVFLLALIASLTLSGTAAAHDTTGSVRLVANAPANPTTVLRGKFIPAHSAEPFGDVTIYQLLTPSGTLYTLDLTREPKLKPGTPVRVTGAYKPHHHFGVDTIEATGPAPDPAPITGTNSVLVMLVSWTGGTGGVTPASAANQVGPIDNNWYRQTSYNVFGTSAQATQFITVPDPGSCDTTTLYNQARAGAIAQGFNPANFNHEMVFWPTTPYCSFAGLGQVSGRVTWINGYMDTRVTVHELGHNLGLWHSHSLTCRNGSTGPFVPWSSTCSPIDEYGDPVDAMGGAFNGVGQFNARQKEILGWMVGHQQAPTLDGEYLLDPFEIATSFNAYRMYSGSKFYWVEYRRPLLNDSFMGGTWPNLVNGVLVHIMEPANGGTNGTNILDMRPQTGGNFSDAALPFGKCHKFPDSFGVCAVRPVGTNLNDGVIVQLSTGTDTVEPAQIQGVTPSYPTSLSSLTTVGVKLNWSFVDTSGICSYQLRESKNGGAFNLVGLSPATATTITRQLTVGARYSYRVTANDCAGNTTGPIQGATFSVGKTEETGLAVTYSSGWSAPTTLTGASGGKVKFTSTLNANAVWDVNGSCIGYVAPKGPGRGQAKIFVDSVLQATINMAAGSLQPRQIVYQKCFPTVGHHFLKVQRSTNRIDVDAFLRLYP